MKLSGYTPDATPCTQRRSLSASRWPWTSRMGFRVEFKEGRPTTFAGGVPFVTSIPLVVPTPSEKKPASRQGPHPLL